MDGASLLLIAMVVGFVHLFLIFGTLGLAAEKNRSTIVWLLLSLAFSPVTFLLMLLLGYVPRTNGTAR